MKSTKRAALRWVVLAGLSLSGAGGVAEQASCHMAAMDGVAISPEKLPPPIPMKGIGNGHIDITSASPEAKIWFDQGLNLLHDFWDYESARAFEQSVRLDPKCAMCWWGLARAEGFRGDNDVFEAEALARAVTLAKDKKNTTEAERLYIEAAEVDAKETSKRKSEKAAAAKVAPEIAPVKAAAPYKDSEETKVLRRLTKKYPHDLQASILLAESLMNGFEKDGRPKAGTQQGQAILAVLLVEHPDDSAVNHYWIHAMEPSQNPERALESAGKLGALAPASGHMVHMPGHIYYRTGDYETARTSFIFSLLVDEAYLKAQNVRVEDDWNYVHNMMYLVADLLEAGRIDEATKLSLNLNTAHGTYGTSLYRQNARDQMTRLSEELPVALRAGDWVHATAMLEKSAPAAEWVNLVELRDSLLEFTRGMAAVDAGDLAGAAKFSAAMDSRLQQKPAIASVAMPGMAKMAPSKDATAGPVHSYIGVAALELQAALQMAEGKASESDATFAKAAAAEHELGYREPPFYIRPASETRGDSLMRAKRFKEAQAAYKVALVERPNSGYPLYGIAQAEAAEGDVAGARVAYAALLKAWAKADAGLPQIVAAKAWMTTHAEVAGE
jgi:tetratricopeptide (TPR) repeat protein